MANEWVDVSIPVKPGMTGWPGDPEFLFAPFSRTAAGDSCNLSVMTLSTHTGTHCDAPWHFVEDGAKLHQVDTGLFFGAALLLDLTGVDTVRAADLPAAPLPPRVLIKTRNSLRPANAPFDKAFVAVENDAAERIAADGVKLLGVDGLSVAPYKRSGPTHVTLLSAGVFVVEGLRLEAFGAGLWEFIVLPMPVEDADGAPCRAFMRALPGGKAD
jgi:arylformamidase